MPTINMRSSANLIKGQGVGSCFIEQVRLVSEGLGDNYFVNINSLLSSDIVHYHTVNLNYYFERQLNRRKTAGVGYVHFLPDTLDDSLKLPMVFRKCFYKYLLSFYNSMDYLVTVNPKISEKLRDYGVTNPKIIYIPNFVSEKEFYPQNANMINETKDKYKLSKDKFTVVGVGQLQNRKGIHDFVATAKLLPDVQFVWAGWFSFGKVSDGYEQIKQLTENPPSNVRFLGMVDRSEMVNIYNTADVFFLPSFDELFPMSILEAFCCKKPVLLRDIDIYTDILFDCYLKGTSNNDFANVINKLKDDKNELSKWKEKSWECHQAYSEEQILKRWQMLYDEAYLKAKNLDVAFSEGNL